ncbi:MAG: DUF1214 domain-containing protein [Pseudomonadales bacterium]
MQRREFLGALGIASGASLLSTEAISAQAEKLEQLDTQSRKAFAELIATLQEVDKNYLSAAAGITRPGDVADGHRYLMHVLQWALMSETDVSLDHPTFHRMVSPSRKALGDNPDAVYFGASIRGDRSYKITGNKAGAVYTSITIEGGAQDGSYASKTVGAINDSEFDVDEYGNFEIIIGPNPPKKNGLQYPADAASITTRHYFEEKVSVAAELTRHIPMQIEPLEELPPPPTPTDASIAAGITRVSNSVRGRTLEHAKREAGKQPGWVSRIPNKFNKPEKPGDMAFAAVDNAYAMAPYVLMPNQALIISGKFPVCRFANIVLWNRFLQTYDYANRQISLNRKQTKVDKEGRFTIVVAHNNPGVDNWIDTEGRHSGLMYWRFLLPEEDVETPQTKVVAFDQIAENM